MIKRTNLDIRFNKASYIINQFSDSWNDDKLILLPNFPKIRDMVLNYITQENPLWLITYDLPYDILSKIDDMGLVPYGSITHEELTKTYYNQNFKTW